MQHTTLLAELASRNIALTVNADGKLQCQAPKGAITPDIVAALKEHRAALIAELTTPSRAATAERNTEPLPVATPSSPGYRPTYNELQAWERYYSSCAWYKGKNIWKDNPVALALPYACFDDSGTCLYWSTADMFRFYALCQSRSLTVGPDSVQEIEPRSFTQMLRTAYQYGNIERIRALASNFHPASGVETILARLAANNTEQQPEPEPRDTEPGRTPSSRSKRQWVTVFADIDAGRAITEQGTIISFPSRCSLATFIQSVQAETSINRVYLCGNRPGDTAEQFIQWLASPEMLVEYTTDAKGHYLDVRKPDASVARYEHRLTKEKIDIRRVNSWLGDSATTDEQEPRYTIEDARDTLTLATRYIRQYFHKEMNVSGTPGATFKRLWTEGNRIAGKKFAVLPDEIRTLIHENAGQGRIEFFSENSTGKLPGLFYYDGIFMYAALTWGMPTELATHDYLNEYAGKVPARYRIQFTVPANWQHIGLFMTPRDEDGWFYPGANEAGNTYETWVDGSELDVAFNLPQGMPTWDITIVERIVFKPETASSVAKPLNTITEKLVKIRDHIARDARQDASRAYVYKLASGIIRNILLHGIGSFNRQNSERSYILLKTEPAPANYTDYEEIDDHTRWYKVSTEQQGDTSMMHPEYAALIWARCRARLTKAALSLPYSDVIAIRTDAIAVKHLVSTWENNTAIGKLRRKWAIEKPLQAPKNDEQLDNIQRKAAHK